MPSNADTRRDSGLMSRRTLVKTLVAVAGGNDEASFIPPLQLTQADAGQLNHVAGCKGRLQVKDPETKVSANV